MADCCCSLTHCGRDKVDAISQTTFSIACFWMKMFEFRLKFHWRLFLSLFRSGDKPLSESMMVRLPTHICLAYHTEIFMMNPYRCEAETKWLHCMDVIFITRVSEVIMFSPCVFVCLWLCLCLYHDVFPDDLTMKDWCHTNNILQVHCWGCLVVQVMFYALMTSSMTSPGHKVGQILKVIYLRQYLS